MSPLFYKVYTRRIGEKKKTMIAGFANRVDAVNFAYDSSLGRYQSGDVTLLITESGRKVKAYRQGLEV